MRAWTKTKPSSGSKETWLKTAARRLRAWWSIWEPPVHRFFRGDVRAAEDESGQDAGEMSVLLPGDAVLEDTAFDSRDAETLLPRPDENELTNDWLTLVQEGAPELLIPPEEGGTPWVVADDVNEMVDYPEIAAQNWPPKAAGFPAPFSNEIPGRRRTKAAEEKLLQPGKPETRAIASQLAARSAHLAPPAKEQQQDSLESRTVNAQAPAPKPPRISGGTEQPGFTRRDSNAHKLVPLHGSTRVTLPIVHDGERNDLTAKTAAPATRNFAAVLGRPQADLSESNDSATRVTDTTAWQPTRRRAIYRTDQVGTKNSMVPGPGLPLQQEATDNVSWQVAPPQAIPERTSPLNDTKFDTNFNDEWPPARSSQAVDFNPWPDLPEEPSLSNPDWMESLRSRDHLQALEVEQQGAS